MFFSRYLSFNTASQSRNIYDCWLIGQVGSLLWLSNVRGVDGKTENSQQILALESNLKLPTNGQVL